MNDFEKLMTAARRRRIIITDKQRAEIFDVYQTAAYEYGRKFRKYQSWLSIPDVRAYSRELQHQSRYIYQTVQRIITTGVTATAEAVTDAQASYWTHLAPSAQNRIRDALGKVPQNVVNEIISGGLYKDRAGLSDRIWRMHAAYERDIDYIINTGIIAQKSAYDLAKDLEVYVNPAARRSFEWSTCYPGTAARVDYNAQRLARTSVTHAYQLANERACDPIPYVTGYKWEISNSGRVCPICQAREGKIYQKGAVPLDHPNGMCVITPVIDKSPEDIADDIADWVNGVKPNPALDAWLT